MAAIFGQAQPATHAFHTVVATSPVSRLSIALP
jgi:hypothetical protein